MLNISFSARHLKGACHAGPSLSFSMLPQDTLRQANYGLTTGRQTMLPAYQQGFPLRS